MKISWLLLTYNRANAVCKAIPYCAKNAGHSYDEVIWVDNGSEKGEYLRIAHMLAGLFPNITHVLYSKNTGVAKGYNTCMANAQGTHMVITGCDMMMPDNWLKKMVEAYNGLPKAGVVTIYASEISKVKERIRGEPFMWSSQVFQEAMPIGRRFLSKELQRKIGYFHEGFGMYGWDDVAWGHTAERVLGELGLKSYNLNDHVAEHLGTEGNVGYDYKDEHEYWRWKRKEVEDPAKQELLTKLRTANWPSFNPY